MTYSYKPKIAQISPASEATRDRAQDSEDALEVDSEGCLFVNRSSHLNIGVRLFSALHDRQRCNSYSGGIHRLRSRGSHSKRLDRHTLRYNQVLEIIG